MPLRDCVPNVTSALVETLIVSSLLVVKLVKLGDLIERLARYNWLIHRRILILTLIMIASRVQSILTAVIILLTILTLITPFLIFLLLLLSVVAKPVKFLFV